MTTPNADITLWFIVFGGGFQAGVYKPCADFSLRIRLDIRCSTRPCTHTFGEWEVETMLGHRCMSDAAILPNGKVLLIGGTEEGLSNLDHRPNSCNCPSNEPWIYDPDAPAGRRYRRTGAYTNIARMYHGSHVMTSYGDILVGGTTIAEGFTSYHMRDFSVTPYQWAEFRWGHWHRPDTLLWLQLRLLHGCWQLPAPRQHFLHRLTCQPTKVLLSYPVQSVRSHHGPMPPFPPHHRCCCRIELFKPHYILGPRPTWASVPAQVEYGSTFTVTLAANTSAADIVAVVLSDPGTATHSSTMASRTMQLAFTAAGGQTLTVTAPASIHIMQPGFYMLFAVSRDDSFSAGAWLRLKGPWGSRPFSLPAPAQFVAAASSQFEAAAGEGVQQRGLGMRSCKCVCCGCLCTRHSYKPRGERMPGQCLHSSREPQGLTAGSAADIAVNGVLCLLRCCSAVVCQPLRGRCLSHTYSSSSWVRRLRPQRCCGRRWRDRHCWTNTHKPGCR